MKYSMQMDPKISAKAYGRALRISTRHSIEICRAIRGKNLQKAKSMLQRISTRQESLDGKFYTNAVAEMLSLLESAESNAKAKGLDVNKLIVLASATKGFTFTRPRSRRKLSGQTGRMTNVQIMLRAA
ncbi:MAG: hypothetical protein HY515_00390 [Candidatus Aenigmarchaeota archaeon]|nr:hypothetical protein [Candidatus Aenigmarchaeota archaeon]